MKKFIALLAASLLSAQTASAGWSSGGGGPPPATSLENSEAVELQSPLTEVSPEVLKDLTKRPTFRISPLDMQRAINAALKKEELPFQLDDRRIINLRPEALDFVKREMKARVKDTGTQILLQEAPESP